MVDCYAVALAEEGYTLRQSGIDKDILVLIPVFDSEIYKCVKYRLTLTVESFVQASKINMVAKRLGVKVKIHIKINTGMNRLGLEHTDLQWFLDKICVFDNVIIDGVYSHYANPQDDNSFRRATDKFLLANNIVKGYNKKVTMHVSASGGFLKGAYFDMVRIGILLYGYQPFESNFIVEKAMRVYAPKIASRALSCGQGLLYGDYTLKEKSQVDLIRFGYADGLPRCESTGQLNNRCMDITATKRYGNAHDYPVMTDADEIAKRYNTISYEVLTKCAIRANKIYVY
jgi:alanine racemase